MIKPNENPGPSNLAEFPSAQVSDGVEVSGVRRVRTGGMKPLKLLFRAVVFLFVLAACGLAVLFFVLSRGAVSNDQLRAQVESQLTSLLGDGLHAKIAETKIAIGKGGLLKLDAANVRILKDGKVNLGVANHIGVRVEALPLIKGQVVAKTIDVSGASISLSPFLTPETSDPENTPLSRSWPQHLDFSAGFAALASLMSELEKNVRDGGLQTFTFADAKLIGFDRLGLRSREARLVSFIVEKDKNFRQGLFFKGVLETEFGNWQLNGHWEKGEADGTQFALNISGMTVKDFLLSPQQSKKQFISLDSPLTISIHAPFDAAGQPRQATANISVGEGEITLADLPATPFSGAEFHLRFLPSKNQIELERSPIKFATSSAVLIGGVRFPATAKLAQDTEPSDNPSECPLFELIANDLVAFGLDSKASAGEGVFKLTGWIDAAGKRLVAEDVLLKITDGAMTGKAEMNLQPGKENLTLDLAIAKMSVADFKQFWPPIIAPNVRTWAADGMTGGTIQSAWVKLNSSLEKLSNDEPFTAQELSAHVPISNSSVKTTGNLPRITNAFGEIDYAGMETTVRIKKGNLKLKNRKPVTVRKSTLKFGDHSLTDIPTILNIAISGDVSAVTALGTLKPLTFTKALDVRPNDLSGVVSGTVATDFKWDGGNKTHGLKWSADLKLKNATSKRPVLGRRLSNADVSIAAKNGVAKIDGTAVIDGVPAKLALVEAFGARSKTKSKRTISLVLDDKARKKMGIDTGEILRGPVSVTISARTDGSQVIEADLKKAKLNFPWIRWSKGKGISAKASFVSRQSKGVTTLKNFVLKGKGFGAKGSIAIDKAGLRVADLRNVILNKTDNFDVKASRVKGGYSVSINAKSYDGRSIIQAFLDNKRASAKGGQRVTVKGRIGRLIGFGGQSLSGVSLEFVQKGSRVEKASVRAVADGNAPTVFALSPTSGGTKTQIQTSNGGSVLRFLDLYSKMRGGTINVNLVRDKSQVFRGDIVAENFFILGEPRLAQLLRPPSSSESINNREEVAKKLKKIRTDQVKVDRLLARIEKGRGFLTMKKGRLTGGDASAAFDGPVYGRNNRMDIRGTYLPGRALNRLVSKIPLIGLAFGKGKVNGLVGITFRLSGPYSNPRLQVNPLSIIAPGVFRQIFKF